jgi:hypothetical protein
MPEPTPADLKRLQTLENRLGKAQAERSDLVAERKELRASVTANVRKVRELEKVQARAATQIESVLAQNTELATQLDEVTSDLDALRAASLELRKRADDAEAKLAAAQASVAAEQAARTKAEQERDRLAKTLAVANEQLAGKAITPVIPAADVARLVDTLVADIGRNVPGLAVRDGEVRLKVAFGQVGRESGFVLPTATSPPETQANLHELALRFDRSPKET